MGEFLGVQEEYIKDEQRNLKKEYLHAQEEVKRIQSVPLVIGQFLEAVDQNTGIVGSTTGSNYYVRILSTLDRELLKPSASVALHKHSDALVDVLPPEADSSISMLQADEKPDVSYNDIGGMDMERQCWQKLLLIIQQLHLFELLVLNLSKSTWEKVQEWSEMYLDWPRKILLLLFSLMKLMLLPLNVLTPKLVPTGKSNVFFWNC